MMTIVLRVLTRNATVDDFVATFRRFSTDTAIFIPTREQRDVGNETAFSLRLVGGTTVLAGLGAIAERHETAHNPFGKPGILIRIWRLTAESEAVFDRLRAPNETQRIPEPVPVAGTNKVDVGALSLPTTEMPPLVCEDGAMCECDDDLAVPAALPDEHNTMRTPVPGDLRIGAATTLGVAPLVPATFVTAPYVIDTPIPRWPRASLAVCEAPPSGSAPDLVALADRPERTAMIALDRDSGQPKPGPWQALRSRLAQTVRNVRWWLRRRRSTQQIRS